MIQSLTDAFIALPGGFGTLEELFEIVTWAQIGYHHKPVGILDDDDGDDPILSVVNIIDVFLVIIAVLLIAVIENPVNPWVANNAVVITNPGTDQMQITIKKGQEMKQYRSAGEIGEGEGDARLLEQAAEEGIVALAVLHLVLELRIGLLVDLPAVLDAPLGEELVDELAVALFPIPTAPLASTAFAFTCHGVFQSLRGSRL